MDQLANQLNFMQLHISQAQADIGALERGLNRTDVLLSSHKRTLDERITNVNNARIARENELKTHADNILNHANSMNAARVNRENELKTYSDNILNQANANNAARVNDINALNAQMASNSTWLEKVHARLQEANNQRGAISLQIDSVEARLFEGNVQRGAISKQIESLQARLTEGNTQRAALSKQSESIHSRLQEGNTQRGAISTQIESVLARLKEGNAQRESLSNQLVSIHKRLEEGNTQRASNNTLFNDIKSNGTTTNIELATNVLQTQSVIARLTEANEQREVLSNQLVPITDLIRTNNSQNESINKRLQENNAQNEVIHKAIVDNKFSDLGILTSLALVVNTIKNIGNANDDLWTAEHYDGSVGEKDGKAVRLFKVQFQSLKSHLSGIMAYYFDMNDKDSAIYKLRYSIVAGAEEIRQLLAEQLPMILESQSVSNQYLDVISTWLEVQDKHFKTLHSDLSIVIQWLEAIFKKPVPSIVVPAFDYERLEKILEKLSFGNTVNEAGENVWSVLKELIKQIGELLKTGLKELSDTAQSILDFLDGLLDDLIRLIVPENMDFFNDSVADLKETSDLKIKPVTDLTGKFVDALNVNDRSRRLRGTGAIFGTSLVDSLKFTIMGIEVDMTPHNSVLQAVAVVRRVISVFVIGYTGFAIKRRFRGKEGLIE